MFRSHWTGGRRGFDTTVLSSEGCSSSYSALVATPVLPSSAGLTTPQHRSFATQTPVLFNKSQIEKARRAEEWRKQRGGNTARVDPSKEPPKKLPAVAPQQNSLISDIDDLLNSLNADMSAEKEEVKPQVPRSTKEKSPNLERDLDLVSPPPPQLAKVACPFKGCSQKFEWNCTIGEAHRPTDVTAVKQHLKEHWPLSESSGHCPTCNMKMKDSSTLLRHLGWPKRLTCRERTCPFCNVRFDWSGEAAVHPEKVKLHIKQAHWKADESHNVQRKPPLSCPTCKTECETFNDLMNHYGWSKTLSCQGPPPPKVSADEKSAMRADALQRREAERTNKAVRDILPTDAPQGHHSSAVVRSFDMSIPWGDETSKTAGLYSLSHDGAKSCCMDLGGLIVSSSPAKSSADHAIRVPEGKLGASLFNPTSLNVTSIRPKSPAERFLQADQGDRYVGASDRAMFRDILSQFGSVPAEPAESPEEGDEAEAERPPTRLSHLRLAAVNGTPVLSLSQLEFMLATSTPARRRLDLRLTATVPRNQFREDLESKGLELSPRVTKSNIGVADHSALDDVFEFFYGSQYNHAPGKAKQQNVVPATNPNNKGQHKPPIQEKASISSTLTAKQPGHQQPSGSTLPKDVEGIHPKDLEVNDVLDSLAGVISGAHSSSHPPPQQGGKKKKRGRHSSTAATTVKMVTFEMKKASKSTPWPLALNLEGRTATNPGVYKVGRVRDNFKGVTMVDGPPAATAEFQKQAAADGIKGVKRFFDRHLISKVDFKGLSAQMVVKFRPF